MNTSTNTSERGPMKFLVEDNHMVDVVLCMNHLFCFSVYHIHMTWYVAKLLSFTNAK